MLSFIVCKIKEYSYYISSETPAAVIDTVPVDLAGEWLQKSCRSECLFLLNEQIFPDTVNSLLDINPDIRIIGTSYILYKLKNILKRKMNLCPVRGSGEIAIGNDRIRYDCIVRPRQPLQLSLHAAGIPEPQPSSSTQAVNSEASGIVLCYCSGLSHTETLLKKASEGITEEGNFNTSIYDLASCDIREVAHAVCSSQGVLFGIPQEDSAESSAMWKLLCDLPSSSLSGKAAAVLTNSTGNNASCFTVRLSQLGCRVPDNGYQAAYDPDENALNGAWEYGFSFACFTGGRPNPHGSHLVKCLICGAIFDSSLGTCPVCGAGLDQCIPVEEEMVNYHEDSDRSYIILGGGPAGLSAADAIRKRDRTGRITMISEEPELPFNRPMLTKDFLTASLRPEDLVIQNEQWFKDQNIRFLGQTSIVTIEPETRVVLTKNGDVFSYDRLIYSLGAECFVPPIPGAEKRGVHTIRHLCDIQDISKELRSSENVVVIGGGVLGLEAASELRKARRHVTVLEMAPKLMGRQLDDKTAERLISSCSEFGVEIMVGVSITSISGDEHANGIVLADGRTIPADLVVISCGNRAVTAPAQSAGIACARSVLADSGMRTSIENIYACGDCAEVDGVNFKLWPQAIEQGRVAGANAAGDSLSYANIVMGMSFTGMNTGLYAIGDVGKNPQKTYSMIDYSDDKGKKYERYWFTEDRICGGTLLGDLARLSLLEEAVKTSMSYSDFTARYATS
ncbi:MAG: FAD-dependent oxidoreductase [Lachnospiraceae bacterium]|jgi:NADPH-dependent 2,4-dienoyl-CoA reductase/sulfur reductase-like enzyme|nr:FAD-dependent oxidoreductase [Lachnospiraceae bacterium]